MSEYDDLTFNVYAAEDIADAMGIGSKDPMVFYELSYKDMKELVDIMRKHGKEVEVILNLPNKTEE